VQHPLIPFTKEEKYDLIDRLDDRGLYLDSLWNLTRLFWTHDVKTAAVVLQDDVISMVFNPDFMSSLPPESQLFVVCHEQLHLMSDHFRRMKFHEGDASNKNRAADVAINHGLVRNFGFVREDFPDWEKYCWVDTVFPDMVVSENETAEHYYALIKQKEEKGDTIEGETLDDHEYGEDANDKPSSAVRKAIKEARKDVKKIEEEAGGEPSEDLDRTQIDKESIHGGGSQQHEEYVRPKKSWNALYAKIPKQIYKSRIKPHWVTTNRRNSLLSSDLMLPGVHSVNQADKVKVNVYLDTSGSCINDARYFLKAALTLPPTKFEVNMFGFCEKVYPVGDKPPLYGLHGFGAESYPAVVHHATEWGHLDAIFVFTDGWSPFISPPNPKKWHWFISPDGTRANIDPKCNVYDLNNFDWKG
jgi:predicted metal-dependent peptidase